MAMYNDTFFADFVRRLEYEANPDLHDAVFNQVEPRLLDVHYPESTVNPDGWHYRATCPHWLSLPKLYRVTRLNELVYIELTLWERILLVGVMHRLYKQSMQQHRSYLSAELRKGLPTT